MLEICKQVVIYHCNLVHEKETVHKQPWKFSKIYAFPKSVFLRWKKKWNVEFEDRKNCPLREEGKNFGKTLTARVVNCHNWETVSRQEGKNPLLSTFIFHIKLPQSPWKWSTFVEKRKSRLTCNWKKKHNDKMKSCNLFEENHPVII